MLWFQVNDFDLAVERARALRAEVDLEHGGALRFTLSLGIAAFSGTETAEGLIAGADEALYRAKQPGTLPVKSRTRRRKVGSPSVVVKDTHLDSST